MDFAHRIKKVQESLSRDALDALIVVTTEGPTAEGTNKNLDYLSGFTGSMGAVVVTKDDAVLVVDGRYTERAKVETPLRTVRASGADRRVVDYTNFVAPALASLGLGLGANLGFEERRVSQWMADAWQKVGWNLLPTSHIIESLRQYKDAQEIAYIKDACKKTCEVWAECATQITAGKSEREVQLMFDMALRAKGASGNSFGTIVASGSNSASPHHQTSGRIIEAGDPVTVDFGGIFQNGYCSDLTRALFVPGKDPDTKLVEIYKTVLGANRAARATLKVGMNWEEYDAVARAYITERGYGEFFTHGLGHSLGLEAHDPFNYAEATFEVGMVITDEPGIYIPGLGGVRIEDDLVITENGVENLTPAPYLHAS